MSESNNTTTATTEIGRIKWFDPKKGYGFVTSCKSNEDIFAHHSKIVTQTDCWKSLFPGEYVSYELDTSDETKTQAVNITGVLGGPLMCETRSEINKQRKEYHNNKVNVDESGETES